MSSSRSIVAKSSTRPELRPSVERDKGTVDRLNEAPELKTCLGCGVVTDPYSWCEECDADLAWDNAHADSIPERNPFR